MKLKIGILEVLVIVSILITSGALVYKFLFSSGDTYQFDGDQMYKCAWVSEKILSKGFPLYADIYGRWTSTGKEFNGTVIIVGARGGTLYGIYNNRSVTIGGEMAYKENIAAEKVILRPLGNTIVSYQIYPVEGYSFKDIEDKIMNSVKPYKKLNITILGIYITGIFAVDSKTYTPTEQQYIRNKIENINNIGEKVNVHFLDNGLIIGGRQKIETLEIYDNLIKPKKILTSKITVYLILNKTLDRLPKNITSYNNITNIITLKN
ncbi:TrmB family transcriptional regulator sugar-binding domain-containing protein [Methanofervidicoccus abyssi]|nr:TrmB family transcriptional regulator sugar-binding domain-containing protein [Methanofervidicoccus abyssi]